MIRGTFTTTSARVAYAIKAADVGHAFKDSEDGHIHLAISRGAGAANWVNLTNDDDWILFNLQEFREVDSSGDVTNTAGGSGVLSSNTTPALQGDAAESQQIVWVAGNADPISAQKTLRGDFDGSKDAVAQAIVRTDNTGGGGIEAASFTLETSWDGGALVSDSLVDASPATTLHVVSVTIAAADIPNDASVLTVALTPGTHANDPIQLLGFRIRSKRKRYTPYT